MTTTHETTCEPCLDTRHHRCRGCACSLCRARWSRRATVLDLPREPRRSTSSGTRQTRPPRPGPLGPGHHGLQGRSTLPEELQATILAGLAQGVSMSSLAATHGISRDKVRTLAKRAKALQGR